MKGKNGLCVWLSYRAFAYHVSGTGFNSQYEEKEKDKLKFYENNGKISKMYYKGKKQLSE